MKRLNIILVSIVLLIAGMNISYAQVGIRTDLGVVGYKTTCFDPLQVSSTPGFAFQLGADYDIHIKKRFYLTPGLYWSYRAALGDSTVEGVYGSELLQENFLNVPIHAKWKFDIKPEKFGMYIYVGPTFSLGMSSRSRFDLMSSGVNVEGTYNYFNGESDFKVPGFSGSVSDELNDILQEEFDAIGLRYSRFEARLDWGVGFIIKEHHEIVTGYDFGLNNRVKGALAENNFMNASTLYIGYRYRFGNKNQ
ncbi:MAG: outer membrane beta-barrel protein [Bacteroidales bacterium]|nr:outer membrane beta-barrel protein [Bacteroidales bacterium]